MMMGHKVLINFVILECQKTWLISTGN